MSWILSSMKGSMASLPTSGVVLQQASMSLPVMPQDTEGTVRGPGLHFITLISCTSLRSQKTIIALNDKSSSTRRFWSLIRCQSTMSSIGPTWWRWTSTRCPLSSTSRCKWDPPSGNPYLQGNPDHQGCLLWLRQLCRGWSSSNSGDLHSLQPGVYCLYYRDVLHS